jgi:hypothetical protein
MKSTSPKKKKRPQAGRPRGLSAPAGSAPSDTLTLALSACRAILFAGKQAKRHRGEYSLNDLLAAESLAATALYAEEATGGGK